MITKRTRQKQRAAHCLALATLYVDAREYGLALDAISEARQWARAMGDTRGRLIAVQCVIAMQAIIPMALEEELTK